MDLIENQNIDLHESWYYSTKFKHLLNSIQEFSPEFTVCVDVGAGSAIFSKNLSSIFRTAQFWAFDINYDQTIESTSTENFRYTRVLKPGDLYILTDVLEHLSHPELLLRETISMAKKDAMFIFTVPAMMSLWSGHDVYLKHFRRYDLESLSLEIGQFEFEILKIHYLYRSIFPLSFLYRKIFGSGVKSQMKSFHPFTNRVLKFILKFDNLFPFNRLPGMSIICVARLNRDSSSSGD